MGMSFPTQPRLGLAILRVTIGVIMVTHGYPKVFQGGVSGLASSIASWGLPLPMVIAWGLALLEVVGGVLLIVGLFWIPIALLFGIEVIVGIVKVHAPAGWYVVGPGRNGIEFNVLILAGLLALLLAGPGATVPLPRRAR